MKESILLNSISAGEDCEARWQGLPRTCFIDGEAKDPPQSGDGISSAIDWEA